MTAPIPLRHFDCVMKGAQRDALARELGGPKCSVLRCQHVAEQASPTDPAPFCPDHWQYLKPWMQRTLREAFSEQRWEDYFEAVRLCADDLDSAEERARDAGFQGIVLARHFGAGAPVGRVVRYAWRAVE